MYRRNANVAIRDRDGLLPLHHAVLRNIEHVVEILLAHTAALTVSALHYFTHIMTLVFLDEFSQFLYFLETGMNTLPVSYTHLTLPTNREV